MNIRDARILGILRMDNCGLVAAFADRLGIVDFLDGRLPQRDGSSFGRLAKGLLVQMLEWDFNHESRLGEELFRLLPTELLLGADVRPDDLSNKRTAELLRAIGEYGVERLYCEFARERLLPLLLEPSEGRVSLHGSLINFLLIMDTEECGVELQCVGSEEACIRCQEYALTAGGIAHEFSFRMAVDNVGVPLYMSEPFDCCDFNRASGNADLLETAARRLSRPNPWREDDSAPDRESAPEGFSLFGMADSSFYTETDICEAEYAWFARVPEKVEAAAKLINTDEELAPTSDPDCSLIERRVEHQGAEQRWILVRSESAAEKQMARSMEKIMEKRMRSARKDAAALSKREFASEEEATAASDRFFEEHPEVKGTVALKKVPKQSGKGKGAKTGETDESGVVRVEFDLRFHSSSEEIVASKLGRFILATNALGPDAPSAEEILALYNRQGRFARGMRFFRGRGMIVDDEDSLETIDQVSGLCFLMTVALAIYNYAESELRAVLARSGEPLLNFQGKPTSPPTLKELFRRLCRIMICCLSDGTETAISMTNMDENPQRVLELLGADCARYYESGPESHELLCLAFERVVGNEEEEEDDE